MSTVLVCYEREYDLESIGRLLESRGYQVITANSGVDALDAARKDPPSLIVSDVLLPTMDGFALCRKCKQDERLHSVPFVFHPIRRNDPKYERFAIEAGAERFIARQGDSNGLLRVIEELLQGDTAKKNASLKRIKDADEQAQHAKTDAQAAELVQVERAALQARIVELQQVNDRLTSGEQRFRQLFEANPAAMWLIDGVTGNFSAVNEAALNLLGYTKSAFLASTPKELAAPAESLDITVGHIGWLQSREGRRIAAVLATREVDFEERRVQLVAATDISARIHAEQVLAQRAQMYRAALAAAPYGFLLLDSDGRLLDANDTYSQMSGFIREELLQMNVAQLELDVLAETTVRLQIKAGTGASRYQAKHRRKDGRLIDVDVDVQQLNEGLPHRVAFIRDISSRSVELSQQALQKVNTESLLHLMQRSESMDENDLLRAIVQQAAKWTDSPFAGLYTVAGEDLQLTLAACSDPAQPDATKKAERLLLKAGKLWQEALRNKRPACDNDPQNTIALPGVPPLQRHVAIPLEDSGAIALLVVANRNRDYGGESISDLQQMANAIWSIVRIKRRQGRTLGSLQRVEVALESAIDVLGSLIESHDACSAANCRRVAALATALGRELELDDARQQALRIAGLLHDVGVVAIPAELWSKSRVLTPAETALMQTHAEHGARLLAKIDFGFPVAEMVYQHHERVDGSGYPRRLKGDEISFEARILAVADSLEAMCSHRPYRSEKDLRSALDELARDAGRLYDEKIVSACIRLFNERGFRLPQ